MAAVAVMLTPPISSVPTALVTFAPCNTAPKKPSTPTISPARNTLIALAPTAGANGVEPDDPAPIDHAMNNDARLATTNNPSVSAVTISRRLAARTSGCLLACRLRSAPPAG